MTTVWSHLYNTSLVVNFDVLGCLSLLSQDTRSWGVPPRSIRSGCVFFLPCSCIWHRSFSPVFYPHIPSVHLAYRWSLCRWSTTLFAGRTLAIGFEAFALLFYSLLLAVAGWALDSHSLVGMCLIELRLGCWYLWTMTIVPLLGFTRLIWPTCQKVMANSRPPAWIPKALSPTLVTLEAILWWYLCPATHAAL